MVVDRTVESKGCVVDMGTIPCFVLLGNDMADYVGQVENVIGNNLVPCNSFAPSIHDLYNNLIYFYRTWANISSAFSLLQTMYHGWEGCIFSYRYQCQNAGNFV
jgi:hypothetical protein